MNPSVTQLDEKQLQSILDKSATYKRVCVVGLGYVGLPTALLFAMKGFSVFGLDVNQSVIDLVTESRVPQTYPELTEWWQTVAQKESFRAGVTPVESDLFLLAVPTPVNPTSKRCDLSYVKLAVQAILPVLKPGNIVILESTVPPGTTRNIVKPMFEAAGFKVGEDIHLCFSPERVLPGNTTYELVHNHRILGSENPESAALAKAIMDRVIEGEIYTSDDITAEFCKLAENTSRDVNIALANELGILADAYGVEIKEAIRLINMHPRVKILNPGIGVGGHCIAVDPWFFAERFPELARLVRTARHVNDSMPNYCVEKIIKDLEGVQKPKIVMVGLTYKPNVGDTRESPALEMVHLMREKGFDVVAFDPLLPEYEGQCLLDVVKDADYLAVLVQHDKVKEALSTKRTEIESAMRRPNIRVF